VAAEVSRWGSRLEHGEWELGRDWMRWRDGVLLGALYRAGRLAGATGERSRWRPVEFNGAAVLSLESALSGPEREGRGGPRLGWKRREEVGPNPLLGLKSKRVKENQFQLIFWIKIGLEIE
jgi:hypothetical protein